MSLNTEINNFVNDFKKIDTLFFGVRLPEYLVEERHKTKLKLKPEATNEGFLVALARDGYKKKIGKNSLITKDKQKEYGKRAEYELSVLKELGVKDYILLVWDVINFCRENNIATGPGRGSAAGSLVLFLIDIVQIDPIKHGLFFERFLSKSRAKKNIVDGITYLEGSLLPDIDLDFSHVERSKVIDYLHTKFKGRTCKILNLTTLSGKLLIKECGKIVADKPESEMTEVSDMIPKKYGKVSDIEDAYNGIKGDGETFGEEWKQPPVQKFIDWVDSNKEVYEVALKLRDLIKNKSAHASGFVISHDLLSETCPLELTSEKEIVSGYDMQWMTEISIKLDLLGLRAVSLIEDVCKRVNVKIEDINVEDPDIYSRFQNMLTPHGLFQIEADTNLKVLNAIKPRNLEELSAVLALARPGALDFVSDYAKYISTGEFQSIHPFFDDILKSTGSIPIYQEQMMKMANKIGFTLDESEILRRIVGKKKLEEVTEWKQKISNKVKENNLPKEISTIFWKLLEDSASYSFNFSHSISYATVSALTTYLKFKYPKEFFVSLLYLTQFESNPIEEVGKINPELAYFDIKLLQPHLMKSDLEFTIEGNDIRFGLKSIKGISDKSVTKLASFRNKYSNKFELFEAGQQAKISVGIISALIQAGSLEDYLSTRTKVVLEAQIWGLLTDKEKTQALLIGAEYNYDLINVVKALKDKIKNEKGKPIIKESRFGTIKKHYEPYKQIYEQNSKHEVFANWYYERALLGYSYGNKLTDIFKEVYPAIKPIEYIKSVEEDDKCCFVGFIGDDVKEGVAKNERKTKYLRFPVCDETGSITVLLFNDNVEEHKKNNGGKILEPGDIVYIYGIRKNDAVFANTITMQSYLIYMKLSELKSANKPLKDADAKTL